MDPNEIVALTVLGGSVYSWFSLFAHLGGAPHFHHHHRRHRR